MATEPQDGRGQQRKHVDWAQREYERTLEYDRQDVIEETITHCSRALLRETADYVAYVAQEIDETLVPLLLDGQDGRPRDYADVLAEHEYGYHRSLARFYRESDRIRAALSTADGRSHYDGQAGVSQLPAQQEATQTVKRAFLSCVAIAEQQEAVSDEYTSRADAVGWALKLGEHLQDEEMHLGDEVRAVADQADYLKSLHCGPTGMGKSTGAEREAEDYLQRNFVEGRDCKVVDMIGFRQGESWLPDVPQQQTALRDALDELGLPPDFTEANDLGQPDVEILIPLTKDVPNKPFPYRVGEDSFVVRPFTIPASELRKPVLVSLIMSRLSVGEENTIRETYDNVDEQQQDWSLTDLADEIRGREELSDKHRSKAIAVLRSLQNERFIRTNEDDRTLDWEALFHDTTTRSIFSQARCSELAGLITFAYQADTVFQTRKAMHKPPDCALLMRELWEVVPHKRRRSFDSRQAAVQEAIGQIIMRLFRQNRHVRCHIIADTQEPNDLLKSVREMFNRYVVYGANRDTIQDIFSWTQNDRWKSFWGTMTAKAGEAGIVGQVEPAIENRHMEYLSPVQMAPPQHHHFDVKTDGTGWHARAKFSGDLDCLPDEELRRPIEVGGDEWDTELPDELRIEDYAESVGDDIDPEIMPLKAFVEECITNNPNARTVKADVTSAFNAFVVDHGHERWDFSEHGVKVRFGTKFRNELAFDASKTQIDGKQAYQQVVLTKKGKEYLEAAREQET